MLITGSRDSVERWEHPTFCLADFQYSRRLFHGVIIRRLFFLEGSEGTRGIGRDTWHSTEGIFPHLRYPARVGPTDVRAQQQYKRKYYFVSLQQKHYSAIRKEFSGENFAPPSGRRIAPSAAPQA